MFEEIKIFSNSNNKQNFNAETWGMKDDLKCCMQLNLGLRKKIIWERNNPVALNKVIKLINSVSNWRNETISESIPHQYFHTIDFMTRAGEQHIKITSNSEILYDGTIPEKEIIDLRMEIIKKLFQCNTDVRTKYGEALFTYKQPKDEAFLKIGDFVETILSEKTKTYKKGYIINRICKQTGTKYTLFINDKCDLREYEYNELRLTEHGS